MSCLSLEESEKLLRKYFKEEITKDSFPSNERILELIQEYLHDINEYDWDEQLKYLKKKQKKKICLPILLIIAPIKN